MNMREKFDELVGALSSEALEALTRSAASEADQRRQAAAIKIEDIHARMSAEDKERAAQEIARVLRGVDAGANE